MRVNSFTKTCAMLMLLLMMIMPVATAASVTEKRQAVRDRAAKTLTRLYEVHPSARGAIRNAAGYAVFNNYGIKFIALGGGRGKGVAVNRYSGREVFMKMAEVDIGFGLGAKNFSVIFVFETEKAFQRFVNQGWEFGGQATVAATDGAAGSAFQGAVSIWPGAWMYQLTNKGLAVELTGKGTRYYQDSELN